MTRALVLIATLIFAMTSPAAAHTDDKGRRGDTTVTPDTNTLDVGIVKNTDGTELDGTRNTAKPIDHVSEPQPTVVYVPVCLHGDPTDSGSGFGCPSGEQLACGDEGQVFTVYVTQPGQTTSVASEECIEPGDPAPTTVTPPIDIPAEVLKEFKKVPLPESTISIQPPGGKTLVNFKTILSTAAAQHQIPVHLEKANIDVVLEVWPSHFLWKHGDGTSQESTIAGKAWSEGADVDGNDFITHVYADILKDAPVSVDTTWSARFKGPDDKDWRAVNGTVTKVGEPESLDVLEATPQLVTDPS